MLANVISLFFSNFGFALFIIALLIIAMNYKHSSYCFAELSFRWLALLPLGVTGIYAFIMHAFFGDFTAATIGWQNSPFQYEVAMANLGFGLIGILAFRASYDFRLAVVIGNTCWLWGDAVGHIYQMVTHHNFAIGNAGSWFWLDVLLPLLLIICIKKIGRETKPVAE